MWATRQASENICVLDTLTVRSLAGAAARAGIEDFEDTLREGKAS